ncbi:MAG: hypothetical protein HZA53_10655 [Planctomycetes bacterium]|nr:hypothetical protein [Planctomycetota bacterium]
MTLGKHLGISILSALALLLSACSGGGSSSSTNAIQTALQDLVLDEDGATTVVTFASTSGLGGATTSNFEADGGQTPTSVSVDDDTVTITWDARVTPSHTVRAVGLSGVSTTFHAVATSDDSAPTFTITSATMDPLFGGDSLVLQFSGPRVVEAAAELDTNWALTVDGATRDLTGATLDFDALAQTLTFTLPTTATLHADFSIAPIAVYSVADVAADTTAVDGTASGDATAPTLVTAEQNLTEDEFGRVIDFTFDKPMDADLAIQLGHFGVDLPDVAISAEIVSDVTVRVMFNGPIVPGVEDVTLNGLVDAHGNDFTDTVQAISQPAPVANAFDGQPSAVTVPNANNDYVVAVTTQAFDPESAEDPANWTLEIDGNTIDLTTTTLAYDLLTKTFTIDLGFDMSNGDSFTLTGNAVLEVDGETFSGTDTATITGDTAPPAPSSVTQNRTYDESGRTLDVLFNEDIDETAAETLGNWAISGPHTLTSATLLPGFDTVRLEFDSAVIPGDYTIDVSGMKDRAGNTMLVAWSGLAVYTTDAVPPDLDQAAAAAVEGANNDTVTVTFDDDMIESEIEDTDNWTIESPIGTPIDPTGCTITYDDATKTATLEFTTAVNLQRGDDFSVTFTSARDIGANLVENTVLTGTIDAETTLPTVGAIYRSSSSTDTLVVRFSEPCANLDDLYDATTNPTGTRYALRTAGGTLRGYPTSAVVLDDGLGVSLAFGQVVSALDRVDVLGVTDLAGNPCFPVFSLPTVAEDLTQPSLDVGSSTLVSVSGASNDVVTVVFDRPMNPWGLLDATHYALTTGATTVDLAGARFTFDGTSTVTIELASGTGNDLATGDAYDLSVDDVWSAQGTQRTTADTESGIVCAGDSTAPTVAVGKVRVDPTTADALIIEVDEDVDPTEAETAANYDYDGGNVAILAERIGPRAIRVTFAVTPTAGNDVDFTVTDLAGNASGSITRTITAADAAAPLVVSVAGTIATGYGGDTVTVTFDEMVDPGTALDPAGYTLLSGSTTLSLVGAYMTYSGASNTVTILLAGGEEHVSGAVLTVTVSGVSDASGNTMPAAVTTYGTTSGDTTAPAFDGAFVNYRADSSGSVVDVQFSEDVKSSFVTTTTNWTATGRTVTGVELLERNHCRVTLSAALSASGTLGLSGLLDFAGNASGAITTDPRE